MRTASLQHFAWELWDNGLIRLDTHPGGGFKLRLHQDRPEEPLSPFLINIRTPDNPKPGLATSEFLRFLAEMFYRSIIYPLRWEFDEVAGPPNAGTPIAEAFVRYMEKEYGKKYGLVPLVKETLPDGRRFISGIGEGYDVRGKRVIIFDDAASEGTTTIPTIKLLTDGGATVPHVLVAIDREQGAAYRIAQATKWRTDLWSVLNAHQLFTFLKEGRRITPEDSECIFRYLRNVAHIELQKETQKTKTAAFV